MPGGSGPTWEDATSDMLGRASPTGGVVLIAASPTEDLLVAGVAGLGLWGSRDGGESWRGLAQTGESALISHFVTSLLFDPIDPQVFWETGIYNGGGVFKSTDGGKTTQQLGVGVVTHNDLVSVDFTDPDRKTLLAGWHEQKNMLFRSVDAGVTWQNVGEGLPDECGFSSHPLVLDAETYLLGCLVGIARTTDGGQSWDLVSEAGGFGALLVASDGAIYSRIDAGFGVVRSDDQGESWEEVTGPATVAGPLEELPDGRLVSMSERSLLISTDRAESWLPLSAPFPKRVAGFTYSRAQRAFYAWTTTADANIPEGAVLRLAWDYEAE
jgi:Photosynthesis system II assembly factor YCF48